MVKNKAIIIALCAILLGSCYAYGTAYARPLIADSLWYGRPNLLNIGDNVWIMIYREASQHQPNTSAEF